MRYRESIDKVNLSMHTSSYIFYAVPQSVAIVNILQFRTYQERGREQEKTILDYLTVCVVPLLEITNFTL